MRRGLSTGLLLAVAALAGAGTGCFGLNRGDDCGSCDDETCPAECLLDAPPRPDGMDPADAPPLADAPPGCGNGVLEAGEACDDMNDDDTDACVRCQLARCGDGVLRARFEQCDDGNLGQDDGCTTTCLTCDGATQYAGASGHCHTRHDVPLPFNEATRSCGFGFLMVRGTRGAQTAVFDALLAGTTGPYWIGLHDARIEGTFEHVNFAALAFTDWNPGQPDNVMGQDCVGLAVSTENWYDYDCNTGRKYVCEDGGDWFFDAAGHGYRVVWGRATWDEAVSDCADLGGYLATPATAEDNDALMAQLPADDRVQVWIGADDRLTPGAFAWIYGGPFVYQDFTLGEPNGDGDCLAIQPAAGGWGDLNCASRHPFVCEVE